MNNGIDINDYLREDRMCKNCPSGMPVKGRDRKRKCTNSKSPDYKKIVSRGNVCDLHEYE